MDYRLHDPLRRFLASENLDRDGVDIIRVAGGAGILARPDDPSEREFVLRQIGTSVRLHGITEIYLVNHQDCGAYGLESGLDIEEELMVHSRDLQVARGMLEEQLPGITVRAYLMWLDGRVVAVD